MQRDVSGSKHQTSKINFVELHWLCWPRHDQSKKIVSISSFFICNSKTKIHDTHDLLLAISLSNFQNFQQWPQKPNCKQLQKTGQQRSSSTFSSISDTFFLLRLRPCPNIVLHFFPVRKSKFLKSFWLFSKMSFRNKSHTPLFKP